MKYKSIKTFFNIEIVFISIIFILLSFFGVNYLIKSNNDIKDHTSIIISNQNKVTEVVRDFNLFLINDGIVFSNSLTLGVRTDLDIDSSLQLLLNIYDSEKMKYLVEEKRKILNNIIGIRLSKKIEKKGYDNIKVIDRMLLDSQMVILRHNIDIDVAANAQKNSDINSQIRNEFFIYISNLQERNDKESQMLMSQIDENFVDYLVTVFILMSFLILSIYFLRYDINKKERSGDRKEMMIDQMIDNQINTK